MMDRTDFGGFFCGLAQKELSQIMKTCLSAQLSCFYIHCFQIKRQANDTIGVDDDIEAYDYNNRNDVENYCPMAQVSDF